MYGCCPYKWFRCRLVFLLICGTAADVAAADVDVVVFVDVDVDVVDVVVAADKCCGGVGGSDLPKMSDSKLFLIYYFFYTPPQTAPAAAPAAAAAVVCFLVLIK